MTTLLINGAKPLDPRREGWHRELASSSLEAHEALVRETECDHPAIDGAYRVFCPACREARELQLVAEGR